MKEKEIELQGVRLHYFEIGFGRNTVLCIHGNPGHAGDFQMEPIKGMRILSLDRPGHGKSTRYKATENHLEQQILLIKAFIEKVVKGPVTLCGHSWGAFICLAFSEKYSEFVHELILFSPMVYPKKTVKNDSSRLVKLLQNKMTGAFFSSFLLKTVGKRKITKLLAKSFLPDTMPQSYIRETLPLFFTSCAFRYFCEDKADFEFQITKHFGKYHKISTPTVIVCGEKDMVSPKDSQSLPLSHTLTNSRFGLLENVGHQIPQMYKNEVREILIQTV